MSGAALNDVVTRLTRVEVKLEGIDAQPTMPLLSVPKKGGRKSGDRDDASG